jgi:transposase
MWLPPVAPSAKEQAVMRLVKRAKLFVWLREHRHELFDEAFQAELAGLLYADAPAGQPPIPPGKELVRHCPKSAASARMAARCGRN